MTSSMIEQLILDNPSFHQLPDGSPVNWSVCPDVLRYIGDIATEGMITLETGAGQTTVAFALSGTNHFCVTPDANQIRLIKEYSVTLGVDQNITFLRGGSDDVLSCWQGLPDRLDFIFIDGAHRFPYPILDWHFSHHRLAIGGLFGIDDTFVPSIKVLYDFLKIEDEWSLVQEIGRAAFFRLLDKPEVGRDHHDQKFNQVTFPSAVLTAGRRHMARLLRKFGRTLTG